FTFQQFVCSSQVAGVASRAAIQLATFTIATAVSASAFSSTSTPVSCFDSAMLVSPDKALPGRATPMRVSNVHAVLKGNSAVPPFPPDTLSIVFGLGCYWGAERLFWRMKGVYSTQVGFAGGFTPNPTYKEVCSGRTGHAEVVRVVYRPAELPLTGLLKAFWESHDPTQGMRQGNDVGTQYRSARHLLLGIGFGRGAAAYSEALVAKAKLPPGGSYLHKHPDGYCGLRGTGVACPALPGKIELTVPGLLAGGGRQSQVAPSAARSLHAAPPPRRLTATNSRKLRSRQTPAPLPPAALAPAPAARRLFLALWGGQPQRLNFGLECRVLRSQAAILGRAPLPAGAPSRPAGVPQPLGSLAQLCSSSRWQSSSWRWPLRLPPGCRASRSRAQLVEPKSQLGAFLALRAELVLSGLFFGAQWRPPGWRPLLDCRSHCRLERRRSRSACRCVSASAFAQPPSLPAGHRARPVAQRRLQLSSSALFLLPGRVRRSRSRPPPDRGRQRRHLALVLLASRLATRSSLAGCRRFGCREGFEKGSSEYECRLVSRSSMSEAAAASAAGLRPPRASPHLPTSSAMPKGKKGGGKKGKKGGKKSKKAKEPGMTPAEAIWDYKIKLQERELEEIAFQVKGQLEMKERNQERNKRLAEEREAYMNMLLKRLQEQEKKELGALY
uniref:peptide-methionine (S)-S-oxide reductase n=1 Tax=Macrostomum lignano TaxID=282301 RepID=A0A1I8FN71_9PLAT